VNTQRIHGDHKAMNHVELRSLDLIVAVSLVPQSVLVEPVVWFGLSVEGIAEVRGTRTCDPVRGLLRA